MKRLLVTGLTAAMAMVLGQTAFAEHHEKGANAEMAASGDIVAVAMGAGSFGGVPDKLTNGGSEA